MPSPTRGAVKSRFRVLLDDPNGAVFTDAIFGEVFTYAYDALMNAAVRGQIPLDELVVNGIHLVAGTGSFNPISSGILDMADYIRIQERTWGSSEKFTTLNPWDEIPQRDPSSRLVDFVYRNNTFYFVSSASGAGATTDRELQIAYRSSGSAPTADGTVIPFDGSLNFLAQASAGMAGPIKGYDELGLRYYTQAFGRNYDDTGALGGELKRIVDEKIRSEQKTPLAIRPYSASRSLPRRRTPYVAAQQAVGSGPAQFSTANSTITGNVDGVNTQFLLPYAVSNVIVFLNGVQQTAGTDYTFGGGNAVNFIVAPAAASIITVEAWN